MIPEPDRGVLGAARAGDAAAFRGLVETLMGPTYAIARRMTGRDADAEDLTQEIFVRLYRFLERFDESKPFGPWYRQMAVRAGLNYLRSKPHIGLSDFDLPAEAPAGDPDLRETLERAMASLPPNYRAVLTLHYLEGQDLVQIGEALEAPVGTIKTWLHRAREALRRTLE